MDELHFYGALLCLFNIKRHMVSKIALLKTLNFKFYCTLLS